MKIATATTLISFACIGLMSGNPVWALPEEKTGLRGGGNAAEENKEEGPQFFSRRLPQSSTRRVFIKYKAGHKEDCMRCLADMDNHRADGMPALRTEFEFDELDAMVVSADPDVITAVESDPNIDLIEDDEIIEMPEAESRAEVLEDGSPYYQGIPYGVYMVQAPQVWATGANGRGVRVCVVDSGIDYSHTDIPTNRLNGVSSGAGAWFIDGNGHGTHVAGTIAAEDDNDGVVGVAPGANLFVVKVFNSFGSFVFTSGLIGAVRVCRDNGADIVNMSLGRYGSASLFEQYFFNDLVNNHGVLPVASAGNFGGTAYQWPASYDSVISVAAINSNSDRAYFSRRNDQVDLSAPGVDVRSTRSGGGLVDFSGTSMAAPHVSGVAALLWSAVPSATATEIRAAMEDSAADLGDTGRDNSFGHGKVQAHAALKLLERRVG